MHCQIFRTLRVLLFFFFFFFIENSLALTKLRISLKIFFFFTNKQKVLTCLELAQKPLDKMDPVLPG